MLVRSIHSLALLATLSLVGPVCAQSTGTGDGIAANPGATLQALETMNNAAASKLRDALAHQSLLEGYVKSAGLEDACGSASSDQHDMAMSFEQALQIAVEHEQSAPTSGSSGSATSGEIKAYTTLARSTWNKLQAAMTSVQHLSDCLHAQNKLDDYNSWENDQAKSHHEAMAAREKEVAESKQKKDAAVEQEVAQQYKDWQAAQKKQHEEYLKHAWTQYKFNTNANLKAYKYEKQYGPNSYNQTYAGNRYGDGGGYGYGYRGAE